MPSIPTSMGDAVSGVTNLDPTGVSGAVVDQAGKALAALNPIPKE